MKFARFAQHFTESSGVLRLMDDLSSGLAQGGKLLMLGGGNPAHIPAVESRLRARMQALMEEPGRLERLVGEYDRPQGARAFAESLARLLRREFGWPVTERNVVLTAGSQSAFFVLFNLFGGDYPDGARKHLLLPMVPEYIGYSEVGLAKNFFVSHRPKIEQHEEHRFKYHIDFDALSVNENTGAICVSRPTNPSGNVLADHEVQRLSELARSNDIPLILDSAYGLPFPGIVFSEATPIWDRHIILCMSLSKLGLPGTRTGIVIADEQVIRMVTALNAIMTLAPNGFGAALAADLIDSGEVLSLSRDVIRPFYRNKSERALSCLDRALNGLPYAVHRPEGALFLWVWLPELPISSEELYLRLKGRGVLVLSGHYFFPGTEDWAHRWQCLRISYALDETVVQQGIAIIGEEVRRAHASG